MAVQPLGLVPLPEPCSLCPQPAEETGVTHRDGAFFSGGPLPLEGPPT